MGPELMGRLHRLRMKLLYLVRPLRLRLRARALQTITTTTKLSRTRERPKTDRIRRRSVGLERNDQTRRLHPTRPIPTRNPIRKPQ